MKIFRHILFYAIAIVFVAVACDRDGYIDPINKVEPGPDQESPVVEIKYPSEGTAIRVKEDVTSIGIKFEAMDDIEIQSISIELDGSEIGNLTEFKDYRRVDDEYTYDQLGNGEHTLKITVTDMAGKSVSESVTFEKIAPYKTQYDGEIFYMPFDASFMELVSITSATVEGSPDFATGKMKQAYKPTANSYITLPTESFAPGDSLTTGNFSATFWYNPSAADASRAGILVITPPDPNNPDSPNNREAGFRLFREGGDTNQTIKLNVGNGSSDSWFDGQADATVDPTAIDWVHVAFTISPDYVVVYLDGQIVKEGEFSGPIGWEGCDILSIGSGAPRFTGWNHLSNVGSLYDELRIFNKALSQQEVQTIMDDTGK